MRPTFSGKRKDANHAPIVAGLEAIGYIVYDMPTPGDILVFGPDYYRYPVVLDRWQPMEIKSDNTIRKKRADRSQELTPAQRRMREKKHRAPIPLVHSLGEALGLYHHPNASLTQEV